MTSAQLPTDAFGQTDEVARGAVDGLTDAQLTRRPAPPARVRVPAGLLLGHHDATRAQTVEYVSGIADGDPARVVDERREPPVTLGVRLAGVVSDDLRHVGQAAYVRGLLPR